MGFPIYYQFDNMDCGPTCLRMIAKYYGKNYSLQTLRDRTQLNREGVNLLGISKAAESIGLEATGARIAFDILINSKPLPCIAHWEQGHFVVIYKITGKHIYVADPFKGAVRYTYEDFKRSWVIDWPTVEKEEGIVLIIKPNEFFFEIPGEKIPRVRLWSILKYLKDYKGLVVQLLIGLVAGSCIQAVFPYLAKSIIDVGIKNVDLNFIYLILLGQLFIFIGKTSVDFIRNWILLHITSRVGLTIQSEFFSKLMRLPLRYFDTKLTGDIIERINDQERVELFLSQVALNLSFSVITLLVFTIVLLTYSVPVFLLFLCGSLVYFLWISRFMSKRREMDFNKFEISSKTRTKTIQMILGMQEIKLNNCEQVRRFEWESLQVQLFNWNIKNLFIQQNQQGGALFINEVKNILITFLAAKSVLHHSLTLGEMLSIQYIIGQLNVPLEQLSTFFRSSQDVRFSMERMNEIHRQTDEQAEAGTPAPDRLININGNVELHKVTFTFPGAGSQPVLKDINLCIPAGKTTAVVGMSGSGKTTLIKLLLKFYEPQAGDIMVGGTSLRAVSHKFWRSKCGAVLQDGFIFSDTIANNISVGDNTYNESRLYEAIRIANLTEFIESLPLGIKTKIGAEGIGMSQGQKQRVLIARAVYKNPEIFFFDEATNALDTENERTIMENLNKFLVNKTVIIVAHRLSTVKHADQIIVLDKGKIIESGRHEKLISQQGSYFNLIKNQLELNK